MDKINLKLEDEIKFLWKENEESVETTEYVGDKDFRGRFLIIHKDEWQYFLAVGSANKDVCDHRDILKKIKDGGVLQINAGLVAAGGFVDVFPEYNQIVFYGESIGLKVSFNEDDVIWVARTMALPWGLQKAAVIKKGYPYKMDERSRNPAIQCMLEKYGARPPFGGEIREAFHWAIVLEEIFFDLSEK
ncbi:MAG: hypothetical protein WC022_02485 [Parcubacteria group bacterium]